MAKKSKCKVCGEPDCTQHCQHGDGGEHMADLDSLVLVPGEWIVDVTCCNCGQGGSIPIDPNDANW